MGFQDEQKVGLPAIEEIMSPVLQKSRPEIKKDEVAASLCCTPKENASVCCTPGATKKDNNGACCAQPGDGSACCDKESNTKQQTDAG